MVYYPSFTIYIDSLFSTYNDIF